MQPEVPVRSGQWALWPVAQELRAANYRRFGYREPGQHAGRYLCDRLRGPFRATQRAVVGDSLGAA